MKFQTTPKAITTTSTIETVPSYSVVKADSISSPSYDSPLARLQIQFDELPVAITPSPCSHTFHCCDPPTPVVI